jgi:signal peptidase I
MKTKKRNKYLSGILSFLCFGLGLIYSGEPKKAIKLFLAFFFTFSLVLYLTPFLGSLFFYIGVFFIFSIILYNIFLSYKIASKKQSYTLKKYNKWYIYLLYIILFNIFVLIYKAFIFQLFIVPTTAMENSILIGDHIACNKMSSTISKRGKVMIFRYPYNHKVYFLKRCVAIPGDELFIQNKNLYLHPFEGDAWIQKHYKGYTIIKKEGKLWVENPYMKTHPGIHHDPTINQDTPVLLTNDGRMEIINTQAKYDMIINNEYRLPKNVRLLKHNPIFQTPIIKVPKRDYFMMGDNRDHSDDSRFWGFVPYNNLVGSPWFIYFSMSKKYQIRWSRIGKTLKVLERETILRRQKEDHGTY